MSKKKKVSMFSYQAEVYHDDLDEHEITTEVVSDHATALKDALGYLIKSGLSVWDYRIHIVPVYMGTEDCEESNTQANDYPGLAH
jgi:hypothetical protein